MSIYAIIYIVLAAIGLLLAASQHGKPKTGLNSFWATLVSSAIGFTLLILGGFFG